MPHIENDRPITRVVISYGENYYRTIVLDAEFIRKKYSREFFTFNSISIVFLLFYLFIYSFLLDTLESFTLKCILIILIGQSIKPWTPCLTLLETATQRSVCEGHFCHLFPLRRGNETTGERYKLLHMK